MNLHSIKSRFLGSYFFIILLLVLQLPLMYFLVVGMSKKYSQVEEAATLKKRAIEISYILNRHILNGEEELEQVFLKMKAEYGKIIEDMKTGTKDVEAITDPVALAKLDELGKKWEPMKAAFQDAMDHGDKLSTITLEMEKTTYPMVESLNAVVAGFVALNDKSYSGNIDHAGLERMRTVRMSYLYERYARSNVEINEVSADIAKTMADFERTFDGLKNGSDALNLRPAVGEVLNYRLKAAEELWLKRKALIQDGMKKRDQFREKITELSNIHTPQMLSAADELTKVIGARAQSSAYFALLLLAVAVGVAIIFALLFIWRTNKHVILPIIRMKETVEGYARGNLTTRANIKVSFWGRDIKDEITSLGDSVDEMAGQMSNVLGKISDSSNMLASASEQLSASSSQIEQGATRQSGQTGQIATAMEEMNATVIEVAKNAQQASESARGAREMASKGGDVVKQAISAMKEVAESTSVTAETIKNLGKSSASIGAIVSVINDIADQTNLLALNAAIEAARAGEQGRGFAVVADEVRKLAERTTKATKEISGMIGAIQEETGKAVDAMFDGSKKVDKGVVLANEAGTALSQIVVGVQNVTDMISHMATSTEEQSATTDEISRNMESIAEVAKTNVSAIGEVARATGEMARLAGELKELVGNFKLYEEDFDAHSRTRTGKRQFYVVKDGKQSDERRAYAADNA